MGAAIVGGVERMKGSCHQPTAARDETLAGAPAHLDGQLVTLLHLELQPLRAHSAPHILPWSGTGFFIDTFTCLRQDGVLWLHGYGNVFVVTLGQGEQIDIEPGGWIYKDRTVQMQTIFQKISTGVFASAGQLFWNRFTGPGRIALQSMYMHMPTE